MLNKAGIIFIKFFLFFFFLTFPKLSISASNWAKAYGGSESDYFSSLQQTTDGGYVVAGSTRSFGAQWNDAWVLKMDDQGKVQWSKKYGGTDPSDWDGISSIQEIAGGGYIAAGETWSFGAGSADAWVLKLDENGNIIWQKTYGGSKGDSADWVRTTSDGGFIVAGSTWSFGTAKDVWILKLDSSGVIQWQKTYGGTDGEEDALVEQTSDGGYIIATRTWSFGAGYVDIWFLKLYANGNVEWERTFGGSGWDEVNTIRQTSDNGYIIAGSTVSFGPGSGRYNAWLIKLDVNGILLWQKTYGGHTNYESSVANWLDLTNDGNIIVAGYTEAFGAGWSDIWVFKVNLLGQILWEKRYGRSTDSDPGSFIQQTLDGGYMVAGINDILDQSTDIYLYKLDESGDLPPCISGFETHATNALVSSPILPLILIYTYNVQNTAATVLNSAAVVTDTTPNTRLMCPFVGHIPSTMLLLE